MCVLANLEYLSILCCAVFWAAAPGLVAVLPMWDSACVWYCHVPGHLLSYGPCQESGPIWEFVVILHRLIGSLRRNCWHLGSLDRSPQDVIQMTMTLLSGSATAAG